MSKTLLIDCLYLVSTILQVNTKSREEKRRSNKVEFQVLYLFCYLAVAFHRRQCRSVPCLEPYMVIQLVLSSLHLVLALLYRVTGDLSRNITAS